MVNVKMKNFRGLAIPLLPVVQIVIVLTVLVVVAVVIAVKVTSATTNELQETGTSVNSVSPTMLLATKAPVESEPAQEEQPPPSEGDAFVGNNGGGMTSAYQECAAQHRYLSDTAHASSNQASQMWEQINGLRNAASAATDPAEAQNLHAQADALQPEAERLNNVANELWQQLFQGHRGVYCNQDGFAYTD